jgi:hypothetical protein
MEIMLGNKLLAFLIEDYSEPKTMPEEKDKRAIKKLLKTINCNTEEEEFIWNDDVRSDLLDLIRRQISYINDEKG